MNVNSTNPRPTCWEDAVDPRLRGRGVVLPPAIVAEGLGMATSTVCRLLREGELKGVRIGKQWRVSRDWLLEHLGLE